jgi:uncharacterized protein YjdB
MAFLAAWLCLWAVPGCRFENSAPDSPYLPGSKDYAGDDWTHDGDGDGVADSVEKYAPACDGSPGLCLKNARILKDIPPGRLGLRAEDLLLWQGDPPAAPELDWSPSEAALRGYVLASSDTGVVAIRGGKLIPKAAGESRIDVVSPGAGALKTGFLARVVAGGVRLDSVRAPDLVLAEHADTLPALQWYPPDATYKDYTLSVEPESVAVAVGDSLRGLRPGRAKAVVLARDGRRRAEFALTVVPVEAEPEPKLTAEPLSLAVGDPPAAPVLAWDPPQAAQSGYRLSLADTTSIVALTPDSGKVAPLLPGTARVRVASKDGRAQAEFAVTVAARRIPVAGLTVEDMVLRLKDGPQAPGLHWRPEDATDKGYLLASRDSSVAVPFGGKVKPIAPGQAVFVAMALDGGFSAEFRVKVQADPDSVPDTHPHPDTATGVSAAALFLQIGESQAPVLAWTPAGTVAPAYALAPEDTAVAAVALSDSGPRLEGRRAGSTQVALRAANGISAVFRVTVTPRVVPVVSIQAPDFTLDLRDGPYDPVIAFTPPNASDKSYVLSAPDAGGSIRIEANKVVPVRPGKSPLRIVPNANPSAAVVCSATVTSRGVRSVSAKNDTVVPGGDPKPAAGRLTWDPPDAPDKSFRLVSKDTGLVRIGPEGTSYQGLAPGKAQIIVQALDGSGASDTFTVLVRVPITRIIAKDLTLKAADSLVNPWYIFTFVPDNASNKGWSFLYLDSNAVPPPSGVVAIVGHWQLRAVGPGQAKLIAYSLDNYAIRDTFTVTVVQPAQALVADTASPISLRVGDPDYRPRIAVLPANAAVRTWHLVSRNPDVASVVLDTYIRPVKAGSAIITAVSDDNAQVTTTFEVRVRAGP